MVCYLLISVLSLEMNKKSLPGSLLPKNPDLGSGEIFSKYVFNSEKVKIFPGALFSLSAAINLDAKGE